MPIAICSISLLLNATTIILITALTIAKLMESWKRSVYDTTLNMFYTNIERSIRRSVIVFNVAFLKPLAEVGTSLCLLLGSLQVADSIIWGALVMWILAGYRLIRLAKQGVSTTETSLVSA